MSASPHNCDNNGLGPHISTGLISGADRHAPSPSPLTSRRSHQAYLRNYISPIYFALEHKPIAFPIWPRGEILSRTSWMHFFEGEQTAYEILDNATLLESINSSRSYSSTRSRSSSFFCIGQDSPEIGSQDTVSISPDLDLYTGPESPIAASPQFPKLATLKKADTVSLLLPSAAFRTYDREVVFRDFTQSGLGENEPRSQRAMLLPPSWEAGSRRAILQKLYPGPGNTLGRALATPLLGAKICLRCRVLNIATRISCVGCGCEFESVCDSVTETETRLQVQPREEALPQTNEVTDGVCESGGVKSLLFVLEQDDQAKEEQCRDRKVARNFLARVFGLRWLRWYVRGAELSVAVL